MSVSPGGGRHRCAQRSEAADRSSLSRHAGQGTPTSGRHAARSAATTDRSSPSRHAGQGTPTSGRHAARSAAKGVYHAAIRMTLNTEVPAEKGPPRTWGSFPPPAFGGLCRPEVGVPLPARRSAWWHGRRDVHHQELNFLARRGVQEDAIMSVSPGGGRHRCAQRSEAADRSSLSRHAGQGTPTSGQFSRWGPAPLREAQRDGAYHAAVRMTLNTEVTAGQGPRSDLRVLLCRTPAAGSAGPHRENCPEVGVPLPARRSALVAWAPRRAPPGTELS